MEEDLSYLKEKVDSGADFIITQYFWNPINFMEYTELCKSRDINVPIIPGILLPSGLKQVMKMNDFCKVSMPS